MRGFLVAVVGLAIGSACLAADPPKREQKAGDRLLRNARIILEVNCLAKRGESVLILTDRKPERMACSLALEAAAVELGLRPVIMDVSVYGDWIEERPAGEPLDAESAVLKPVRGAVEAADIVIRVGGCPQYGTILGDADANDRFLTAEDRRVSLYWRKIDQEDVAAEEVAAIRQRTTWLAEKLHTSQRIRVSTSAGTQFSAGVGPGAKWHPILAIVPLYGEVAVIPQLGPATEGVFVVDGPTYYGVRPQAEIDREPLRITVKAGCVEDITGDAEQVARLKKAIAESGSPRMAIDEVGLVTTSIAANDACWASSGTHRHDSIHIAVGNNFRRDELVHGVFHMDCEILRPTVWLDEQLIVKDGVFQDSVLDE